MPHFLQCCTPAILIPEPSNLYWLCLATWGDLDVIPDCIELCLAILDACWIECPISWNPVNLVVLIPEPCNVCYIAWLCLQIRCHFLQSCTLSDTGSWAAQPMLATPCYTGWFVCQYLIPMPSYPCQIRCSIICKPACLAISHSTCVGYVCLATRGGSEVIPNGT